MISRYKSIMGSVLVVLILVAIIGFSARNPELKSRFSGALDEPDFVFENARISQFNKGEKVWSFVAERSVFDKKKQLSRLEKVKGSVFNESRKIIDLISPNVTFDDRIAHLVLTPANAHYYLNGEAVSFSCKRLTWDEKKQYFHGQKQIKITHDDFVITGKDLFASVDSLRLRITGNPKAVLYVND